MKVFKFGGASVKDAEGIINACGIIQKYANEKLVVIVSASGKTTNALEEVANAFYYGKADAKQALEKVRKQHIETMDKLFEQGHPVYDDVHDTFAEIEWVIEEDKPEDSYDFIYDQVVSMGEFMSTKIVAAYLNKIGRATTWVDVRDIIKTDETWREANVNWDETEQKANAIVPPLLEKGIVLTQGFVGSSPDNATTTLGREGSDYTAAIFAWSLHAESMTIWKDVPGVLNADPRIFENAIKINNLSYEEAIEMTYYGAQVIHPKTMRPIQSRNIPLYVNSFIEPDAIGTIVSNREPSSSYPPVIVVKKNQCLLEISSKDFYFINEEKLSDLFEQFTLNRIKVNMMQNTAMKFLVCTDDIPERLEKLIGILDSRFHISAHHRLELLTVRHYNPQMLDYLKFGKKLYLEERIPNTVQMVLGHLD